MTLGNIIYFYNAMKMNVKLDVINDIVSTYEKEYKLKLSTTPSAQEGFISNMFAFINKFRNSCAHEERLYSQIIKNNNKILNIVHFHKSSAKSFSSHCKDLIIILGLFISKNDYKYMIKEVEADIDSLSKQLPQNMLNQVLMKMGFSKNWKSDITLP